MIRKIKAPESFNIKDSGAFYYVKYSSVAQPQRNIQEAKYSRI